MTNDAKNQLEQIKKRAARFNDMRSAFNYAANAFKTAWVMLGDDGKFWVVRPVDAARLEEMGYEYAN